MAINHATFNRLSRPFVDTHKVLLVKETETEITLATDSQQSLRRQDILSLLIGKPVRLVQIDQANENDFHDTVAEAGRVPVPDMLLQ